LLVPIETRVNACKNVPRPYRRFALLRNDDLGRQFGELRWIEQRPPDFVYRTRRHRRGIAIDALGKARRLAEQLGAVVLRQAIARCE
jgi:hypothetical protein